MKIVEVVIKHIRRRIQRAQRAIQRQRRRIEFLAQALAQHHLHTIAIENVLLGASHGSFEIFFAELRTRRARRGRVRIRWRLDGVAQLVLQFRQAFSRQTIGVRRRRIGVHDEIKFAAQVVEHHQFRRQQQHDVGQIQRVNFFRCRETALDVAHRVVAEIADQPAAKSWQAGDLRDIETFLIVIDEVERIDGIHRLDRNAVMLDRNLIAEHADAPRRRQADEGIATKTLAADDGFQKIGVRRAPQFEIDR